MQTIIHEMRGIPFFLLKEYLQEMGGSEIEENLIQGEGWRARLERMEPFRLYSLSVGQTRLTVEMEDHVAEDFIERFKKKTLRAGG
ncbi:MAG: DUF1952 domain-containing protein [Anaerolineales bacterium]|nr:DUF1952 domain-containing protein [Anaerolineales bacterium]